jgi:glucose-1-phosphate cytidylyltransferase
VKIIPLPLFSADFALVSTMKTVILAGGLGTRIAEETEIRPKPMIEIGGRPLLWHIMKLYAHYGINEFIVCLGYKGYVIKEFFQNYFLHSSDITINLKKNTIEYHNSTAEPWTLTLVDTGEGTETGGRLRRVRHFLRPDEPFCFTYGDGLSDIDITSLVEFHKRHGKEATVSAVVPPGRYGALELKGDIVQRFTEKPPGDNSYINGGFFVLQPSTIDRINDDTTSWEGAPLAQLAEDNQLCAFHHHGFWHAVDTLRDKRTLEQLWASGCPPWRVWDQTRVPSRNGTKYSLRLDEGSKTNG